MIKKEKTSLLLSGGGARAAYQIGVLKAINDIVKDNDKFQIYCGVSAGAINATSLASNSENESNGINELVELWRTIKVEDIYKTDRLSIMKTAYPWVKAMLPIFRRTKQENKAPMFLLDNQPLTSLLDKIKYEKIKENIANNKIRACSVTCSSYHSGQSVSFFEGNQEIEEWFKMRRIGVRASIDPLKLMASSALPMIFPAKKIKGEWFGDGSMRQLAPLSTSIRLGATKILIIGTGRANQYEEQSLQSEMMSLNFVDKDYPSLAQIGGHILNSLFLDNLYADIERFKRTNELIENFNKKIFTNSEDKHAQIDGIPIRKIDLLMINPSKKLDEIASYFTKELPENILRLLKKIGANEKMGGGLTSYLLFEKSYCNEIIELGYEDGWKQKEEIIKFFEK